MTFPEMVMIQKLYKQSFYITNDKETVLFERDSTIWLKSIHTKKQFSKCNICNGFEIRQISDNAFTDILLSTHVHENVVLKIKEKILCSRKKKL